MTKPCWHIVCGSTGAGKTTRAIQLSAQLGAIRFSIDEWMTRLFWPDSPEPIQYEWTMERINRCEAQIAELATQLASLGISSVLDLGFTTRDHRDKFRALAAQAGIVTKIEFVDVPAEERWARVQKRNQEKGETYRMEVTREMFDFMERIWEAPGANEVS